MADRLRPLQSQELFYLSICLGYNLQLLQDCQSREAQTVHIQAKLLSSSSNISLSLLQ